MPGYACVQENQFLNLRSSITEVFPAIKACQKEGILKFLLDKYCAKYVTSFTLHNRHNYCIHVKPGENNPRLDIFMTLDRKIELKCFLPCLK